MSRITESFVKKRSIAFLKKYYCEKYSLDHLYIRDEVCTQKELKGRADGFLCFNSEIQERHTVSIEAKSHKTLNSLFPYINFETLDGHIALLSLLFSIGSLYFIWNLKWYWLIGSFLLFFGFYLFSFLFLTKFKQPKRYFTAAVVRQVSRYPANEKWIAVSRDSLNLLKTKNGFIKDDNYEVLKRVCRKKGVGLLVINGKVPKIILEPQYKKGDFLRNYRIHEEIKSFLDKVQFSD